MTEEELNELNSLPKTQKEAKEKSSKYFFTGRKCSYGHLCPRYTSARRCIECHGQKYKFKCNPEFDDEFIEKYKEELKLPRTKEEGKLLGSKYYFTGLPCKHGHYSKRLVNDSICIKCQPRYHREFRARHPGCRKEEHKKKTEKLRNDPIERLKNAMSCSMRRGLKGKSEGQSFCDFVGYTIEELKKHIESLFEPGMTWENYGNGPNIKENGIDSQNRWHIDHIIPISLFPEDKIADSYKLENLQPLWACDNMSKCNRYIGHPDNKLWIKEE